MKMYTKKALSVAEYSMMRGVTDFSNAAQFNLYETGYSHLIVISKPKCITMHKDQDVVDMMNAFCYILEYEFRGLSGIEDITADSLEVTDGISTLNVIGKVNKQSASEISMTFTEKSGSIITNFLKFYLEGLKDPRTQAKTYHGLIKYGVLAGGFENEVFNLLYIVTDNTMLQIEKAYLLCNAWPNKATTSIYNTEKGNIEKQEIELTWNCFVIDGADVDERAMKILAYLNEQGAVQAAATKTGSSIPSGMPTTNTGNEYEVIHLDSNGNMGVEISNNIGNVTFDKNEELFSYKAVSGKTVKNSSDTSNNDTENTSSVDSDSLQGYVSTKIDSTGDNPST